MPDQCRSYTGKLTSEQTASLVKLLKASSAYTPVEVPFAIYACRRDKCQINVYHSNKVLVQGIGTADFVQFTLEPKILKTFTFGHEKELLAQNTTPHMGSDESGKGDFFGPLVVCAAYVDATLAVKMHDIGVRDCKLINYASNKKIAKQLRDMLGPNRYKIVTIGPEAYNRLYTKTHNVNSVLAWGHARAIEDLLVSMPTCPRAVVDQFAVTDRTVTSALMERGRKIKVEQFHKAEADIAVAAASIIARAHFLAEIENLSREAGMDLPKGASNGIVEAGTAFVEKLGPAALAKFAKCHFTTTETILNKKGFTRQDIGPFGIVASRQYLTKPGNPQ